MPVDPNTLDWKNLGFGFIETKSHLVHTWKDGKWDDGVLTSGTKINLDIGATALHYGQSCFEGIKAYRMKDGKIRIFRPEVNAERMINSCKAAAMQYPSIELFKKAVRRVVEDNKEYVPPYGSGGTLYIRPFLFGSGPKIGLSPADEYKFIVLVTPVGEYYKGGLSGAGKALIKYNLDRVAPFGSGRAKLGGNYASTLAPAIEAKHHGYMVLLFLDAAEHKYIDEFQTSNFAAIVPKGPNGKPIYVTPKTSSALLSVTNRSLFELAQKKLGWEAQRRRVTWDEVKSGKFTEIAACGTAVVLSPISEIHHEVAKPGSKTIEDFLDEVSHDWKEPEIHPELLKEEVVIGDGSYENLKTLYNSYLAIQFGDDPEWNEMNWMWPKEGI